MNTFAACNSSKDDFLRFKLWALQNIYCQMECTLPGSLHYKISFMGCKCAIKNIDKNLSTEIFSDYKFTLPQ